VAASTQPCTTIHGTNTTRPDRTRHCIAQLGKLLGLQIAAREPPGRLAIALSWALDFASHGVAIVGPVAGGLPRPKLPTPPLDDLLKLVPAAFGLFLVSFADEILTARAFAGKRREHVRASQELLTMAAANVAAGFTQAFSVGASGARTAEAYRDVALHPSPRVTPGVVAYRLDDRLFFANARYAKGRVQEAIRAATTQTSWFVFDAEAVNHIDSTGVEVRLAVEAFDNQRSAT
jgi:MFS superfamily sulfate permease-like transporter